MDINPVVLAAALSSICTAIAAIGVIALTKRSEERRHLREVAFATALENWKYVTEAARAAGEPALPLDVYLLHMVKLSELLSEKRLDRETIIGKIGELREVINAGIELAEALTADGQERARRQN